MPASGYFLYYAAALPAARARIHSWLAQPPAAIAGDIIRRDVLSGAPIMMADMPWKATRANGSHPLTMALSSALK